MICVGVFASLVAAGCTRVRPDTPAVSPLPVDGPPFRPTTYLATPQIASDAKYRDLMTSDSYMIWVSDDVARIKFAQDTGIGPNDVEQEAQQLADARLINANFLVFELHIKSAFGDPSIANEFTRMEDVELYLTDDSGHKVSPSGIVVSRAERTNRGPLREFARTVVIAFPRYDIFTGNPNVHPDAAYMRVFIDGYETLHMFEWIRAEPPEEFIETYARQLSGVMQAGYTEFYGAMQTVFKNFK